MAWQVEEKYHQEKREILRWQLHTHSHTDTHECEDNFRASVLLQADWP